MKPEVFAFLQRQDWAAIGKRLVAFGLWWASRYQWRKGNLPELAQGKTIEDIIQTVVEKTFSGQRRFDPMRGPLEPWLRDQIKSEIDALARSAAHRCEESQAEDEPSDPELLTPVQSRTHRVLGTPLEHDPEAIALSQEEIAERSAALFDAIADDKGLEAIVVALLDGCEPVPRILAAELGVSVEDIYNRVKRLRRRVIGRMKEEPYARP